MQFAASFLIALLAAGTIASPVTDNDHIIQVYPLS